MRNTRQHVSFAALVLLSSVLLRKTFGALFLYALRDESGSHILLIPFICLFLLYADRASIFPEGRRSIGLGAIFIAVGSVIGWQAAGHSFEEKGGLFLSEGALAIVTIWIGCFVLCYGLRSARAALFPLLFLLLMVPLPAAVLNRTICFLQQGSTDVAYFIFRSFDVPVLRRGFILSLSGVTIEVAKECSGIRSSMALLITCLLAAHLSLHSGWKRILFVAMVIPLSVVKNGIRIATLTLLALFVDPRFLTGSLHRDGGFVFFLLALGMLWPILRLLQKSERPSSPSLTAAPQKAGEAACG